MAGRQRRDPGNHASPTQGSLDRFFARFSPTFWTLVALGASLMHHADHVLRYDHSGWPFTPDVNAFTFSLVAYPMIATILCARSWPGYQAAASTIGFIIVVAAHTLIETPRDQYHTWAAGVSNSPQALGTSNLLDISSPTMGVAAVVVANVLHVAIALAALGYARKADVQGMRKGPPQPTR